MGRTPSRSTEGVRKGAWTSDEDKKLIAYIKEHGEGGWRTLPQKAGLQRCGKSCRLRWTNYLRPDIKRGEFSPEEDQKIIELHTTLGNKWSAIAKQLEKRTDNEIKNYWNSYLKKRAIKMIVPNCEHVTRIKTFLSTNDPLNSTGHRQNNNANNYANHSSQGDTTNMVSHKSNVDPRPDRPSNTIQRSAYTKLLNRLATRLPSSYCLNVLKDGPLILSPSSKQVKGKDVISISDTSSSDFDFRHSSFCARSLLNKMAHGINRPSVEMVKSRMSKCSITGTDTCTSIGDALFRTNETNGHAWIQPTMSMLVEATENLAFDIIKQDVPSHGVVQNKHNGNSSVESLIEDFNLDFLQDWAMMVDDDNGTIMTEGISYEGGVSRTNNCDNHNFESPMSALIDVNIF